MVDSSQTAATTAARATGWWKRGALTVVAMATLLWGGWMMYGAPAPQQHEDWLTHAAKRGEMSVTVIEHGTLESADNTEIKCKVRGDNTVIEVVESGTWVQPGDVLVRLDTLFIEEQIAERTKYAHWTRSSVEHLKAHFARSKLAVDEYRKGRYVTALKTLEKDLAIAKSNLITTENMLAHATSMQENGYVSQLEVREKTLSVSRSKLAVDLTKTQIDVLKNFTKNEMLATLRGNLRAAEARFNAEHERLYADQHRLQRAVDELQHCVVRAEKAGMVIHPSAAKWKDAPEIEEGGTVYKDQILLLMPDLSKMQVKVGVHESIIDRIKTGLKAQVTLPDHVIEGEVTSVASVTSPAGWWTGNQVKYDTIISLPDEQRLRPGMSAEVEIILASYEDVLTVPVAAVVETEQAAFCWVSTTDGPQRREVRLGDSDDISVVVKAGLREGDNVILNPSSAVPEAQDEAAKTLRKSQHDDPDPSQERGESDSAASAATGEDDGVR